MCRDLEGWQRNDLKIIGFFGLIFFIVGILFYFRAFDFNAFFMFVLKTDKLSFNPSNIYYLTRYFLVFTIGFLTEIINKILYYRNSNVIPPFNRQDIDRAWQIFETRDRLVHNRINYFIVAESMLLFSCVTSLSFFTLQILAQAIAFTGCIITIAWYYNLRRIRVRMNNPLLILKLNDPIWQDFEDSGKTSISGQFILTSFLPSCILFLWIFILFFSFKFNTTLSVYKVIPNFLIVFFLVRTYWEYRFQKKQI